MLPFIATADGYLRSRIWPKTVKDLWFNYGTLSVVRKRKLYDGDLVCLNKNSIKHNRCLKHLFEVDCSGSYGQG